MLVNIPKFLPSLMSHFKVYENRDLHLFICNKPTLLYAIYSTDTLAKYKEVLFSVELQVNN